MHVYDKGRNGNGMATATFILPNKTKICFQQNGYGTSSIYLAVHLDIQKEGCEVRACLYKKKEIAMAVYNIN